MDDTPDFARLESPAAAWRDRLRRLGLDGIAAALLEAAEPLSPVGAQVLYVAQPALSLFVPAARVGRLARRLEDPAAVARFRAQLLAEQAEKEADDPAD